MHGEKPFILLKRKQSENYYVRLKDDNGKVVAWKSTGESNYSKAMEKAWNIYFNSKDEIKKKSVLSQLDVDALTESEVVKLLEALKEKGFITSYIQPNKKDSVNSLAYCYDFWNPAKSQYLKEKSRKGHTVHLRHISSCNGFIRNYWEDILENKSLGEVTKNDIQKMFDRLDNLDLNGNTKNHILRSVLTPLKYAYSKELIDKDLTFGWTFYQTVYKEKVLLTKEMAVALFKRMWKNPMAKLANMVAMCTGMRAGEILALTPEDLGEDCIYVNHSWNALDKLKSPKNGETRIEYVYSQEVIFNLLALASTNYHKTGIKFIFYSTLPNQPLDEKVLTKSLRYELKQMGMAEEEVKKVTFHAWRHFYTTYMRGKVDDKLLKSQTGHKTLEMLNHYSNHQIEGDIELIKEAQKATFEDIIPQDAFFELKALTD